mgnify:CR=1 FL=1
MSAVSPSQPVRLASVRVGVTGHRFLMDIDELIPRIDQGLDTILKKWSATSLIVVSPLAEGGDRLVAQRALLRPGTRLVAALPMPEDEFAQDFRQSDSRREFFDLIANAAETVRLPPQSSRRRAYELANHYVLEHCDVLMALWDGQSALGEGGTATMVALARRMRHPLYWIWAGNYQSGATLAPKPARQGLVQLESF